MDDLGEIPLFSETPIFPSNGCYRISTSWWSGKEVAMPSTCHFPPRRGGTKNTQKNCIKTALGVSDVDVHLKPLSNKGVPDIPPDGTRCVEGFCWHPKMMVFHFDETWTSINTTINKKDSNIIMNMIQHSKKLETHHISRSPGSKIAHDTTLLWTT